MLKGDFVLAKGYAESVTHLAIGDGRTITLCGGNAEWFSDTFSWIGQVRCQRCRQEYGKLANVKGDLE